MTRQADEAWHGDVDVDGVALEVRMQAGLLAGSRRPPHHLHANFRCSAVAR
jgi:hypothetical protein